MACKDDNEVSSSIKFWEFMNCSHFLKNASPMCLHIYLLSRHDMKCRSERLVVIEVY